MRVILLVDDKKLGKRDSVIEVADSYATNVLLPKCVAVAATKDNLAKLEAKLAKAKKEFIAKCEQAASVKSILDAKRVFNVSGLTATGDKLYGAVTAADIAKILNAACDLQLTKQNIMLEKPIKTFGEHTVTVKLFNGLSSTITVKVEEAV